MSAPLRLTGRLRRAMTVDMVVDPLGNVSHVKAYPSVMPLCGSF